MILAECPNCKASLAIEENDYQPGCRDIEEVFCPKCEAFVTKVFTSDMPTAHVTNPEQIDFISYSSQDVNDSKPSMINELKKHGIRALYHFTDERNIPGIRKKGLCPRNLLDCSKIYTGGNDWSVNADDLFGLDKYVHLCLYKNHPMAFNLQKDETKSIAWLEIALDVLNDTDILYCAEVANKSGAQLLTESEALETFDFEAMGYIPFDIDGNQKRKQQVEKYEILVPHIISVAMIGGL